MKEEIITTSYNKSLCAVIDKLSERNFDLSHKHILIVPDRCTLTAERAICERFGGSFDVSVKTWSRLIPNLGVEYLPKQGSVMLVRSIIEEQSLECYGKSASKTGFAQKLYETISQLAVCEISPEEVADSGAKGKDVAMVYAEYLKRTSGRKTDSAGKMRIIRERLETTDFLKNTTIYIACFDTYTKQMQRIIDVMAKKTDVYIYNVNAEYSFGEVELYASSSPVFSAKAIATRIANDYRSGIRYDDIAVVTENPPDEIVRVLSENGLPCYATREFPLSSHALGRFINLVYTATHRGEKSLDVVRIAKNPFSGVKKDDCDAFERYVFKYGITYKLFEKPFSLCGESDGERQTMLIAERARAKVWDIMKRAKGSFLEGVYALIEYASKNYSDDMRNADDGRANPFDNALVIADLCKELLSGKPDKVIFDAFCEGMQSTNLSAMPKQVGVVEIGCERDFRARKFRRVYVADFNSDSHPVVTADSGLISDDDIMGLREKGTVIEPTTSEVNARARDEFFLLISGVEKVMLIYNTDKPCSSLSVIKSRVPITHGSTAIDGVTLRKASGAKDFLKLLPTKNMIFEEYLCDRASGSYPQYYPYAEAIFGDSVKDYAFAEPSQTLPSASELMTSEYMSVSRLQQYFSCPQMHFLKYGLCLTESESGEINSLDVGVILHSVAENYVKIMNEDEPEVLAVKLLKDAVSESGKGDVEANAKIITILEDEAKTLCRCILTQSTVGEFKPIMTEATFGFEGDLSGVELDADDKKVTLRGKIDRVDEWNKYVRVVDYKSGGDVTLPKDKMYMGVKIQLLLYLSVLIKAGYKPSGAFYFPTYADFADVNSHYFVGLQANDEHILTATDKRILSEGESVLFKVKKNKDRAYVGEKEFDVVQLTELVNYAERVATLAVKEMSEGYVAQSPAFGACQYCAYASACGYEGEERKSSSCEEEA